MTEPTEPSEWSLTIADGRRAERADKALAQAFPQFSRSRLQKLFAVGRVWREDESLSQSDKVRPGDTIQFTVPPPEPLDLTPVAIPLDVVFEDEDLLVINKACGMVVHPGNGTGPDTLVHALLHHCKGALSGIGGTERPGIVHRLDKETSGLIVVAKSDAAFSGLARQFAERKVGKTYRALVMGRPQPATADIIEPIGRHPVQRTRMAVRSDGRPSHSRYHLLASYASDKVALVDVDIFTGRTHQIRVHMAHIGHPLAGDSLYGYRSKTSPCEFPRVMLHAAQITFRHPVSQQDLNFQVDPPHDFSKAVKSLEC
ncbi:MAG: RluA family pseudouridine synthase [Opitutales bacterium]|nr:RluA family pseudouridine synthase [Opitutales bacterium]